MRRLLALLTAVVLSVLCLQVPAEAAGSGSTSLSFGVVGGSLGITLPTTVPLGYVSAGQRVSVSLGSMRAYDLRGGANVSWAVTVTSSAFVASGAAPTPVHAGDVWYTTKAGSPAASLAEPVMAHAATNMTGDSWGSWNPTVTLALPDGAAAGRYTGTITNSVA